MNSSTVKWPCLLTLSSCVFIDSFVILYVMARDDDEGENGRVSYRIQGGNSAGRFSLNPNTGKLNFMVRHTVLAKNISMLK